MSLTVFPDQRKRHKSDSDSAVEMCLDKNPKAQLDFVVVVFFPPYMNNTFMPLVASHLCIAMIDKTR